MNDILLSTVYTLIVWILAFIFTNVDDLFILIIFYSQKKIPNKDIILGQYLGFILILGISLIGFIGAMFIPLYIIGLLGIIPIVLGVKHILSSHDEEEEKMSLSAGILTIASITFADSADNFSIYIPLFASVTVLQLIFVLILFLLLVWIWCMLAKVIAQHKKLQKILKRYSNSIIPAVFIILGVYILYKNGTISWMINYIQGLVV
jgi:cadmium resistance transport/sequestration family protein